MTRHTVLLAFISTCLGCASSTPPAVGDAGVVSDSDRATTDADPATTDAYPATTDAYPATTDAYPATTDASADSSSADATDSGTKANPCSYPLVRLQTGQDPECPAGNEHLWPVGMDASACHGWTATDPQGELHENSANQIQCHPDGTFSFAQYAGNLDCSGSGVVKSYAPDTCQQDIPPKLYTMAVDLSCCSAPGSPECLTAVPSVSSPGGQVYLNGELCEP